LASLTAARLSEAEAAALEAVLETTSWVVPHVRQVQRLSAFLFGALRPFHGLSDDEEKLLLAGALLHDVGYPADPPDHHKASARTIRSHLGPPFDARQVELIALVARYHRKGMPKLRHRRYVALGPDDRRLLCWLAGILRVADGLDRAHRAAVRSLTAAPLDGRLEIVLQGADLDEDIAGAMRKRDLLERTVGMPVVVRASSA
jgi:exopolyphosphatase/guanosine-5'-triphosphate,3'-diphosphate pyrophosphatase